MYFWRIAKLKQQMIAQPLSDREVLPYIILASIFAKTYYWYLQDRPIAYFLENYLSVFSILATGFGIYYIYLSNHGTNGRFFLQRYFVIEWVLAIRWTIGVAIGLTIIWLISYADHFQHITPALFYQINCIYDAIAILAYYWLLGRHVHDVALRTSAAQPPELPTV